MLAAVTPAGANVGKELWNNTYNSPVWSNEAALFSVDFQSDGTILSSGWRHEQDSTSAVGIRNDATTGAVLDSPAEWILYPSTGWGDYTHDRFYGQSIDGNDIYLGGWGRNDSGSRVFDPALVKYRKGTDGKSVLIWEKRYTPTANEYGGYNGVGVSSSGAIYAAGFFGVQYDGYDWFINKFDSDGNEFTGNYPIVYDYDGLRDQIEDLAIDRDGNFIVAGWVTVDATTDYSNWFVRKYSNDGQLIWEDDYDHNNNELNDHAQYVTVDGDNNIIVSGYVNSGTSAVDDYDWYIVKYAANGTRLWAWTWDIGNSWGIAYDVITDTKNNIYVLGTQTNASGLRRSYLQYRDGQTGILLKYQELSHTAISNPDPDNESDYLKRMVLKDGKIVLAGHGNRSAYPTYTGRVAMLAISDTYNVTPGTGDPDCSDGECNLQAALTAAASNNGINVDLNLQQGVYTGNFVYQPTTGNNGDLSIQGGYSADFLHRTVDPTNTILDGGNTGSVLRINPGIAEGTTAINGSIFVSGITVRNGNATSPAPIGGGMLALVTPPGRIELSNNIIENNHADETGGGCAAAVWDFSSTNGGDIFFSENIVRNNSVSQTGATDGNGGGCSFMVTGTTMLANNLVYNNSVGNTSSYLTADGGGFDFDLLAGSLVMTNNTIADNEILGQTAGTASGGGVSLGTDSSNAWGPTTVELNNSIIYNNQVSTGLGNDIHNRVIAAGSTAGSTLAISNCDYHGYLESSDSGTVSPVLTANFDAEPKFSEQGSSLYSLVSGSPCIDSGDNNATGFSTTDLAGAIRPQDGNGDGTATANMGCYETIVPENTMPWLMFMPAITGMHP